MTHFRDDATVCLTREQFDAAVARGDPAPMLLTPLGRQREVDWRIAKRAKERADQMRGLLEAHSVASRNAGGLTEWLELPRGVTCATCLTGYCPAHGTGLVEVYCAGELVAVHRIGGVWRCEGCGGVHNWVVW